MKLHHLTEAMTAKVLDSTLTTYSPSGRARNLEFTVAHISKEGITFRKQNGKEQTARENEIAFVCENWERVKSGEVKRAELARKSFNTSYLFGLFHFIEREMN